MIPFDHAVQQLRSLKVPLVTEEVPLARALGRVLPRQVEATLDQPPFDKAAMDGWAHDGGDSATLNAITTIAAGEFQDRPVLPGEAVKIMTGAPIPPRAKRVQRIEWSELKDGLVRFTRKEGMANIIRRGENARAGSVLLHPRVLAASDLAVLAADGRAAVEVARRPVVGVLSTGSELFEPGVVLDPGGIYDSNRIMVLSQLAGGAADLVDLGTVPDDATATRDKIAAALERVTILVLSGGVSRGDFDHVPQALDDCGVRTEFHWVAVKPGRPTYFGRTTRSFVFGLAGNPVSVFVHTELLVRTLIMTLSGLDWDPKLVPVPVAQKITRRSTDRIEFVPISIDSDGLRPVDYGGPSALQALAETDGLVRFEVGQREIEAKGVTNVRRVR